MSSSGSAAGNYPHGGSNWHSDPRSPCYDGPETEACPNCDGAGTVPEFTDETGPTYVTCPVCDGKGELVCDDDEAR